MSHPCRIRLTELVLRSHLVGIVAPRKEMPVSIHRKRDGGMAQAFLYNLRRQADLINKYEQQSYCPGSKQLFQHQTESFWQSSACILDNMIVDVFWVNPNLLDVPIFGVLFYCRKTVSDYSSEYSESSIPAKYVVYWRKAKGNKGNVISLVVRLQSKLEQ